MKTVRDACQLQPNALSIKLSDQIEQLDELISAEGNGAAFFKKTHIREARYKNYITTHRLIDFVNNKFKSPFSSINHRFEQFFKNSDDMIFKFLEKYPSLLFRNLRRLGYINIKA